MKKTDTSLRAKRGNPIKLIIIGLALALIIGLFYKNWIALTSSRNDNEQVIKIGVIGPLSGDNAKLGKEGVEGVEFAIQSNHPKKKFEFIFEDDQRKSFRTVAAANKLIMQDKVDVIINYSSHSAAVVAPIAAENNVLQFAFSSDDTFTQYDGNYAYATPISIDARVLLTHLQKQGYKRAAMISEIDGYFPLVGKWIKDLAPEYDVEIVFDAEVNPNDRDFKSIITKAELQKPNVYILQAWMPIVNILMKQVRDVQREIPITSTYSFGLVDDTAPFEGLYFVNFGYDDKGFDAQFTEKFGRAPGLTSAIFYSMTDLLIKVLDNTFDYKNTELLRNEIEKEINKGDTLLKGMKLQGNTIAFPSVLVRIVNGKEEIK